MDAELSRAALEREVIAAMERASSRAMAWGEDDCALWAVEPIRRALGYDPAAFFRGRYRTRIGAGRVLGQGGLAAALRLAARRHRWRRITPGEAQPGDLALTEIGGVYSMVVCRATGWFVGRGEAGFAALPAAGVRLAWAVL